MSEPSEHMEHASPACPHCAAAAEAATPEPAEMAAECRAAMRKAGCKLTPDEIGKSPDFIAESFRYHPYMRRRLSLKRMSHMLDLPENF